LQRRQGSGGRRLLSFLLAPSATNAEPPTGDPGLDNKSPIMFRAVSRN
jgi:hypothetical protein